MFYKYNLKTVKRLLRLAIIYISLTIAQDSDKQRIRTLLLNSVNGKQSFLVFHIYRLKAGIKMLYLQAWRT